MTFVTKFIAGKLYFGQTKAKDYGRILHTNLYMMKFFLQLAICTFRTLFAITVNLHVSKVELRCRLLPVKHGLTIFSP
jgi:hypothetical protein